MPLWRLAQTTGHGEWVLPASHFLMDESPDHAARRVASDWAGLPRARPTLIAVTSELMPTGRVSSHGGRRFARNHWALCFLYELSTGRTPARRPGWSELRYLRLAEIRKTPIGRGHRDLVRSYLRAARSAGRGRAGRRASRNP